jgi:hypothetical protein
MLSALKLSVGDDPFCSPFPKGRDVRASQYRFELNGIEHRILDAIQGHRPRSDGDGYGEVTIKMQAAAIAKLPRYKVSQSTHEVATKLPKSALPQ